MLTRTILFSVFAVFAAGLAAAQSGRSVALVVSVGGGTARADAIQAQLQIVGTETLRAANPNNAELRSVLTRFAAEALNSEVGVVYIDGPVVDFDGRAFVVPAGTRFRRATDVFTQTIPLSAFARATELANSGGVVLATAAPPPAEAPEAIRRVAAAPEPLPGLSPVLLAQSSASETVVRELAAATLVETVELGEILERMAADPGITLSQPPRREIFLREPAFQPEIEAPPAYVPEPEPPVVPEPVVAEAPAPALTLDELIALDRDLSRSDRRSVQEGLRAEGFYSGFIDGILGPQSREAISTFQEALGAETTGYLTPEQLERLLGAG